MKNPQRLILLVLLLMSTSSLYAQMGIGKPEEIAKVKKRKLIVMIEEPREKILKKLARRPRKGDVDDYKADLAAYNANAKAAVEKFWPYNKAGVQYMTFDQIKALAKKSKEYAVLYCVSARPSSLGAGFVLAEGLYWVKDVKDDFEERDDLMVSMMGVNLIEDFTRKPVYYIPLFDVFPTKASLVYGIKGIEQYFKSRLAIKNGNSNRREEMELIEKDMAKRIPALPNKTLIIRQEWLDEDITKENIKEYYPYPCEIVTRDFMDEVVINQDSKYAYGVVMPYVVSGSDRNTVYYFQYVIDGADSQPMAFIRPSGGSMFLGSQIGGAGKTNFTKKIFTRIVEEVKGDEKGKKK